MKPFLFLLTLAFAALNAAAEPARRAEHVFILSFDQANPAGAIEVAPGTPGATPTK